MQSLNVATMAAARSKVSAPVALPLSGGIVVDRLIDPWKVQMDKIDAIEATWRQTARTIDTSTAGVLGCWRQPIVRSCFPAKRKQR